MNYFLKNKDKNILEFEVKSKEIDDIGGKSYIQYVCNLKILDDLYLPKTLDKNDLENSLKEWISKRKIPSNRRFVEKIVSTYSPTDNKSSDSQNEKNNFMDYIDISLGLSLNDTFWIAPVNEDYKWENTNLYDNEFNEILERVAFMGASHKISGFTLSPEYTTNGMLRKCWHRENGETYLYKASSTEYANGGKEAYSEYYMCQIAKTMGFDCIEYDLKKFHETLVSSCKIFTSEKEGYMPMNYCLNGIKITDENINIEIAKIYGEAKFRDLLVFDALIYNTDRHLGNFGMIIDNDTGELLRPAPIFDNGLSILNHFTKDDLKDIESAKQNIAGFLKSQFGYSFDTQLERFIEPRHKENFEKLLDFKFKRHKEFNLDDDWLIPVENHIRERAKLALKICEQKNSIIDTEMEKMLNIPSVDEVVVDNEIKNEKDRNKNRR